LIQSTPKIISCAAVIALVRGLPIGLFVGAHLSMKGKNNMNTILLVILILLLLGALPTWPYSANWGYYPSGGIGLILVIVVILAVLGRI